MVDEVKTAAPVAVAPAAPAPAAPVAPALGAPSSGQPVAGAAQAHGVFGDRGVAPVPAMPLKAPPVELAGVPETPPSNAAPSAVGAAVPSTDHYLTEGSPNKETSSDAPTPPVYPPEASI